MANLEIEINLVNSTDAVPRNIPKEMHRGDTVHYSSPDGEVMILFPLQSPFRTDHAMATFVFDSEVSTVRQLSPEPGFPCRCFIKPKTGKDFIGWKKDPSKSGGNHVVKP